MLRVIFALFLLALPASAGEAPLQFLELRNGMELRASPPTGSAIGFPGAVTSRGQSGKQYVVLRNYSVQQGFSRAQWSEVAPLLPGWRVDAAGRGWILRGEGGEREVHPDLTRSAEDTLRRQIDSIRN